MADTTINTNPNIKQGDAYRVPVWLYFNGEPITEDVIELLEEIEFAIGDVTPVRLDPRACYSAELGAFLLPVTQEQTFALEEGSTELDVRVQFLGGDVLGAREKAKLKVLDATSEEVL